MNFENALKIVIGEIRQMIHDGSAPPELSDKHLLSETTLAELYLDSLGRLSLLSAVEDRADVILSEGDLQGISSIGDLAQVLTNSTLAPI